MARSSRALKATPPVRLMRRTEMAFREKDLVLFPAASGLLPIDENLLPNNRSFMNLFFFFLFSLERRERAIQSNCERDD